MKKILLLVFCAANVALNAQKTETISTGAGYVDDVYYSFANGVVKTEPRANWHIAFTSQIVDAAVWINEGLGVELYVASTDVNDWANLDTAGMSWTPLYNSPSIWEEGAFNDNNGGHPDYGWGNYSNITNIVSASKIYLIKLPDGTFKKIIIDSMLPNGDFNFRIANLDGTNELLKTYNKLNYSTKNFFYYDAIADTVIDREPAATDWDILFTRYMEEVIPGTYYPVGGVYMNKTVTAAKAQQVDTNTVDWNNYPQTDSITTIGSNWKTFDNGNFVWNMTDSLAYFIAAQDGNLYKLIFKDYAGSGSGNVTFTTTVVSAIGLDELINGGEIMVYPQPASTWIEVAIENKASLSVYDLKGAEVLKTQIDAPSTRLDVSGLNKGVYIMRILSNGKVSTTRVVIQ